MVMRIQSNPLVPERSDAPSAAGPAPSGPAMPADEIRVSRTQQVGGSAIANATAARVVVDAAQRLITDAPVRALVAQGNAAPDDVRRLLS